MVAAVGAADQRLYGFAVLVLKLNRVGGVVRSVVVVVYGVDVVVVVVGRGVVVVVVVRRVVVVVVGRRVVVVVVVVLVVVVEEVSGTEGSSLSSRE